MDLFEAQFPDALESLARAMRAGHPLQTAIEILANDLAAPLGPEFRRIRDERRLGMPWKATLEKFSERVPILEVRLFVAAALISSRSGGRFTEVLENLAETVREGVSLRGEVRAVSAHGRMTGGVLTILPFGIATMLYLTSPDYLLTLVDHPFGPMMIGAAILLVVAGHFVIQRIVSIRV
jgi:tight adherence protein B